MTKHKEDTCGAYARGSCRACGDCCNRFCCCCAAAAAAAADALAGAAAGSHICELSGNIRTVGTPASYMPLLPISAGYVLLYQLAALQKGQRMQNPLGNSKAIVAAAPNVVGSLESARFQIPGSEPPPML